MSLLLDALKKSGHGQAAAGGEGGGPPDAKPSLSLEEPPAQRPQPTQQALPGQNRSEPARDGGRNLFASKKTAPAKKRKRLGIVPITLIGASVFGAGYGYYVYREVTGLTAPARAAVPPAAPPAPAAQPPAQVAMIAPRPVAEQPPVAEKVPTPQSAPVGEKPAATYHHRAARSKRGFTIEKHQQADTITPLLEAAYRAYRAGDFATAQKNYSEALRQDSKNHDALLGLATISKEQGQDALAAQYYGQMLALDPRDAMANAGMATLEKGGQASRESRLKLLLEQQPQSAALHFALGNLYSEQKRWPDAQQAYFDSYSLQPDAAQYAYNLAVSLDHLGQGKLAAQYYRRALDLDASRSANIDRAQTQRRLDELRAP